MSLQYFIPDWDDRVDPGFNFLAEQHTPNRVPYRDDCYAHEIYSPPPYDGVLLSRAVLDANTAKRQAILDGGGVKPYLRLPKDRHYRVMGDCGAFTYWEAAEPPYETADVLEYYEELGFDLGVSIDHLIFTELESEKERRWEITSENAREFIRLYRRHTYHFTPIGVAQGWDPASYQRSARALVKMGYQHIAVGGLVRSRTDTILDILTAVQTALKPRMGVHLFGVNRPEYARQFAKLGITSFDSASRLRRAWMDGRRNYFLGDESYMAIRIPEAGSLAKSRSLDVRKVRRLERKALACLRDYDQGKADLESALEAAMSYADLGGLNTDRVRTDYRKTLEAQPWKRCPCRICGEIGIEVVIFRGNNRNRRRGFHNTWQLYQDLQSHAPRHPISKNGSSRPALPKQKKV